MEHDRPGEAELLLGEMLLRTGSSRKRASCAAPRGLARRRTAAIFSSWRGLRRVPVTPLRSRRRSPRRSLRFPEMDELRLLGSALLERQGRMRPRVEVDLRRASDFIPTACPFCLPPRGLERDCEKTDRRGGALLAARAAPIRSRRSLGLESAPSAERKRYLDLSSAMAGLPGRTCGRAIDAVKSSKDLCPQPPVRAFVIQRERATSTRTPTGSGRTAGTSMTGKIVRWIREPAEDGVAQYGADFQGGRPATLAYERDAGRDVTLTLQQLSLHREGGGSGGHHVLHRALHAPVRLPAARCSRRAFTGLAPRIASRFAVPTLDQMQQGSVRVAKSMPPTGSRCSADRVSPGAAGVHGRGCQRRRQVIDHRVWYANGMPARGERSPRRNWRVPGQGNVEGREAGLRGHRHERRRYRRLPRDLRREPDEGRGITTRTARTTPGVSRAGRAR